MLRYNAYMIVGKILIDSLRENRNIIFDSEDIRRFNIGLLSVGNKKIGFGRWFLSLFSVSKPYFMGYYLQKFIEKEIKKNNIEDLLSDNKKANIDIKLEKKYELVLPKIMPYFNPSWSMDLRQYLSVQYKYNKCQVMDEQNEDDMERLETEFVIIAKNFYYKYYARIGKRLCKYFRLRKTTKKWSADNTKNSYYKKQWDLICQEAYRGKDVEISNLNIFFNGVMEELDNILVHSNAMCRGWDRDEKRIIFSSASITIIDAVAVAFNALNDENSDNCIKKCAIFFTILATAVAAVNSAFSLLKNHHAYRETWLRHQLNYSRLTAEIENFCECMGDYKIDDNLRYKDSKNPLKDFLNKKKSCISDNKNIVDIQNKYKENISKFQKRIAELRKMDYENFFTNMDCINFNDESK